MGYLQPVQVGEERKIPTFQKVLEVARGGFVLDITGLTKGEVLKAGTPMTYDENTRKAKKANVNGSDVKGLLYESVIIQDNAPLSVVTRGTVYNKRIEDVPVAIKNKLPLIVFSDSL